MHPPTDARRWRWGGLLLALLFVSCLEAPVRRPVRRTAEGKLFPYELCSDSSECISTTSCWAFGAGPGASKLCSVPCVHDDDCGALRFVHENSGVLPLGRGVCTEPPDSGATGASSAPRLCVERCDTPSDCPHGFSCLAGACMALGCGDGQAFCGGRCVDVMGNEAHCGACDNACSSGLSCIAGVCQCNGGGVSCGDTCVDLESDPNHCGECFARCNESSGARCEAGSCVCPDGSSLCDGSCYTEEDYLTSWTNCGGCGFFCPVGTSCVDGECGCPDGHELCGGTCVDYASDPMHCGACHEACAPGIPCEAGECRCPAGTSPTPSGCAEVPRALVAGGYHTCVVSSEGEGYCWGQESGGADPSTVHHGADPVPLRLGERYEGDTFTTMATSTDHSCGIGASGRLYWWGIGHPGPLGSYFSPSPSLVETEPGTEPLVRVVVGEHHSCGLTVSGRAYCWGDGTTGGLGNGGRDGARTPTAVSMPEDVVFSEIAAGGGHTCALTDSGKVYCWGRGNALGVPNLTPSSYQLEPIAVDAPVKFKRIVANQGRTCALSEAGELWCWGEPLHYSFVWNGPTLVAGSPSLTFAELALGGKMLCALTKEGRPYCLGASYLGDGELKVSETPVPVSLSPDLRCDQIALGTNHACVHCNSNEIYCWGDNSKGQLGDGQTAPQGLPIRAAWPPQLPGLP